MLGRPEARPKAPARSVYDEARGMRAPARAEPKDYLRINVQNAVRAVPRQPPARAVDTRRGSTLLLETSGLEPKYIFRKVRSPRDTPTFISAVLNNDSKTQVALGMLRASPPGMAVWAARGREGPELCSSSTLVAVPLPPGLRAALEGREGLQPLWRPGPGRGY